MLRTKPRFLEKRGIANRALDAGADVTLVELPGVGHGIDQSDSMTSALLDLTGAFLAECLGVPRETPQVDPALGFRVVHDEAHVPGLSHE